jgi:hypothetical protein
MCELTQDQVATFPRSLLAPASARSFVREHACRAHTNGARDDLVLLASELVTASLLDGRPPVTVQLACRTTDLELRVADTDAGLPGEQGTPGSLAIGFALGLVIVEKLSSAWGSTTRPAGQETWCRLSTGLPGGRDRPRPAAAMRPVEG